MKTVLLAMMLSFFSPAAFTQQYGKDYYLAKSKRQKTTGRILLIGGGTLFAASFLSLVKYESVYVTYLGGIGIAIAGVPFMNASVRNKRMAEAISASLKFDKIPFMRYSDIKLISYPSIAIMIHLEKHKRDCTPRSYAKAFADIESNPDNSKIIYNSFVNNGTAPSVSVPLAGIPLLWDGSETNNCRKDNTFSTSYPRLCQLVIKR